MFQKIFFLFIAVVFGGVASAQPSDYWQQHVRYQIEATLLDSVHSLDGRVLVEYTNNSPDTLREVYFHLYANAFKPGSMMHQHAIANENDWIANKFADLHSSEYGGYTIRSVSVDGVGAKNEVTGTIMKVFLAKPLSPKSSVTLGVDFFEQIPKQLRRMGWMNSDSIKYSMAQWYPKVCEYDREGWHNQEYIVREFYGVWGEFDVTLRVPAKYCVGATGQVQNPNEVGWGYESIASGTKKGKVYPSSIPKEKHSSLITWKFKAANVHDFAWVAHEYIHEWDTWMDTVTVHCLYKTNEEGYWRQAMGHTMAMLDHHSKKIGWYQYRNFYNTHAGDGGMEYPQLIMDGSPNAGLIMHEGAHQWFYGMLGSNETRYAFLDEGFTEFLEMVGMESYFGRHNERSPYRDTSWLTRMFIPEYDARRQYYRPYLDLAASGYEEPLMLPHDWARENVNAGQAYFKTLNGLAQLEYVLGDSVFWAGMKEYFRRWHFKHPNLNDFKRTMEDVSEAELDWYFDQWFSSTRTIDYFALDVNSEKQSDDTYQTTVKILNLDQGVMPLDLTLNYDDGTKGIATIPLALNQGGGYKKPETGRIFFPSWDWVGRTYVGTVSTPKEVSSFDIDTSYRLMDLNRGDNRSLSLFSSFANTEWSLWKQWKMAPPLSQKYGVFRPIVWYGENEGLNLGIGLQYGQHRLMSGDVKIIVNTNPMRREFLGEVGPKIQDYIDYKSNWTYNTTLLGNLTTLGTTLHLMYDIGIAEFRTDHIVRPTYRNLGPTITVSGYVQFTGRYKDPNHAHPSFGYPWSSGNMVSGGARAAIQSSSGLTKLSYGGEIGSVFEPFSDLYQPDYSYQSYDINLGHTFLFRGGWNLRTRGNFMMQAGNSPMQKRYYLASGNGYNAELNDFWKAVTGINTHFSSESHFFLEGGGGVRGYQKSQPVGQSGFGLTAELTIPNPIASWGWLSRSFEPILFVDCGMVGPSTNFWDADNLWSEFLADAGIGFRVDVLSWLPWQLQGVAEQYAPIPKIGFYFPIYLNHPDDGKGNFAFRYAISLGTTF